MRSSKPIYIKDIKESRKNNIIFHSLYSTSSNIIISPNNNFKLIHDYTELITQGSSLLLNNNFYEALESYQKALSISEKLMDDFKKNESKCNIGIANFYLGKISEAISNLQSSYTYINSICSFGKGTNDVKSLYLLCKSGANLCMCQLTMNSQDNNCISIINNIIDIISNEEDLYKQIICVKYLNNILFRVNSLIANKNNDFNESNFSENNFNYIENENNIISNNNIEEYQNINQLFIQSFNYFNETYKIEQWLNSLNIIYKKIQKLNDKKGIIYIQLNQLIAICLKNNYVKNIQNNNGEENNIINPFKEKKEAKEKLTNLLQQINDNNNDDENNFMYSNNDMKYIINEEDINSVIEDYKLKIFKIRKIYLKMYSLEEQITQKIQEYENNIETNKSDIYIQNKDNNNQFININKDSNIEFNINCEFYFKLLLNYTKNNLKKTIEDINLKKKLMDDIEKTIELINSKKIDISKINMSSFDSDISKSLSSLFNDLFTIYKRNKLRNYLKEFQKKTKKNKNNIKYSSLKNFLEREYYHIFKGEIVEKINYHSSRIKQHFYKINNNEDIFESFPVNQTTKPSKTFKFDNIIKILVGLETENLKKKVKTLKKKKMNKPYYFLSLVLKKRTIDLCFKKEISSKKWFYGFYQYFQISERPFKTSSCTKNILFRIKIKIINTLKKDNISVNKTTSLSSCLIKYFKSFEENNENEESIEKEDEKNENEIILKNSNDINIKYKQKVNNIKKKIIKRQKELGNDNSNKDPKEIEKQNLIDMSLLGTVIKSEIIKTKKENPNAFISIKEATKNKDKSIFGLGIMANILENKGIETVIERGDEDNNKIDIDKDDYNSSTMQFLLNGLLENEKYNISFDFGKKQNNKLINDENEQEKLNKTLKNKISKEYGLSKDEVIIIHPPQKLNQNHYDIQLIFQNNDFNNLDLKKFQSKFKNDDTLCYLKDIHKTLIMEGCKLSEDMLDSRGNKFFKNNEEYKFNKCDEDESNGKNCQLNKKRGGYDYYEPIGWMGFGLKVLGKYDNGNNDWLACNGNKNEWAVAYHGIGISQNYNLENVINNIANEGFKIGKIHACQFDDDLNHKGQKVGIGIYCSPNPLVMEQFASLSKTNIIIKGKRYQMGFMMRVKPDKIRISSSIKDYWVLNPSNDEIRPYRILVKEN